MKIVKSINYFFGNTLETFFQNKAARIMLMLVLFGGIAYSTLQNSIQTGSWSFSHETSSLFERSYIYVMHYKQWDFFPLWSSMDNFRMGSPLPALYHKLFYYVSSIIYFIVGNYITANMLGIWFFLVLGAVGTYRLSRYLGCSYIASICGGAMLIVANYTITNWLIRGAVAELSGEMLIPWFFIAYFQSLSQRKITVKLAFLIGLIYLAHSLLVYYLVLIMGFIGLIFALYTRSLLTFLKPKNWIWSVFFFILVFGPHIYVLSLLSADYDISRILQHGYHPRSQFVEPLSRYYWDTDWDWSKWGSFGYTIQLDLAPLVFSFLCLLILFWPNKVWPKNYFTLQPLHKGGIAILLILFITLFISTLLQFKFTLPFYEHIPGAEYVQFPWRLLSLVTPVLIVFALSLGTFPEFKNARAFENYSALVVLGLMLFSCGAYAPILVAPLNKELNPPAIRNSFSYYGEYVRVDSKKESVNNPYCYIEKQEDIDEDLHVNYSADCEYQSIVVLEINRSPLHLIEINGEYKLCGRFEEYPALCALSLPKGETNFIVHIPTFFTVPRASWYNFKALMGYTSNFAYHKT